MCFSSCYFLYIKGNSLSLPTFSLIQSISVVLSKYCSFMYYDLHPMIIRRPPGSWHSSINLWILKMLCRPKDKRQTFVGGLFCFSQKCPSSFRLVSSSTSLCCVRESLSPSSSLVVSMVYISSPVVIRPLSTCVELPIYSFIRLLSSSLALFRG